MSQPTYTYSGAINQRVAAEIMDANTRVKRELDDLHTSLQSSLAAWQSPTSRDAYNARKTRWDNAAAAMPVSLQMGSEILTNVTTRLNQTESAITDSWG
ncbi:hypothetical protein SAMN04488564_12411 [Lentzea waywayandensis]|uniref:WXG100 family type VII secretion target n=1 Tax=Lentzea waywayandensis TaxID=84724 RepID=A0A1I6FJ48_9PSEU|nr:hypothetical protein [Lentzea waywayandensis]SFR29918.1 hypothetical protein SAMN04488564_12411 [Lentzea waywayandensis]